MKKTILILFLLINIIVLAKDTFIAEKGVINLSDWDMKKDKLVPLKGEWEFYWEEFLNYSDTNNDIEYVKVPNSWTEYSLPNVSHKDSSGYATYKLKVILPENNRDFGIRVKGILLAYDLYIDDKLILSAGEVNRDLNKMKEYLAPKIATFHTDSKKIVITVQVSCTQIDKGGIWKSITIGSEENIINYRIKQAGYDFLVFGALLLLAIYHFIIFFFRKKEKSNLYLALLIFFVGLRIITVNEKVIFIMFENLTYPLEIKLEFLGVILSSSFLFLFIRSIFKELFNHKFFVTINTLNVLYTMFFIFGNHYIFNDFTELLLILLFVENIYILYIAVLASIQKKQGAKTMALGLLVILFGVVMDGRIALGILDTKQLIPACIIVFIILQSSVVAKKIYKTFFQVEILSGKLKRKNVELYALTKSLEESNKKLEYMNINLEDIVKERTHQLNLSKVKIQKLLDNAEQGFLYFTSNLRVKSEYSLMCYKIFGREIAEQYFPDLIYPYDSKKRDEYEEMLLKISNLKEKRLQDLYIPLLPDKEKIEDKHIKLEYKIISSGEVTNKQSVMVILSDISEEIKLKNQVLEERNNLKMIIEVYRNNKEFRETMLNYQRFCKRGINDLIFSSLQNEGLLNELFRNIHTFKGDFAQLNMLKTAEKIHNIEDILASMDAQDIDKRDLINIFLENEIEKFYEEDLEVIKEDLGDDILENENINYIKEEDIRKLEEDVSEYLKGKYKDFVLSQIKKLRYKKFDELVASYNNYIQKISDDRGKNINKINFSGEKVFLNPNFYSELIKSFTHIFRNIVDHGIEDEEERIYIGKEKQGNIYINTKIIDDIFRIEISDDGQGVNIDEIKEKIVERGLISKEKTKEISNQEIIQYIFRDRITNTKVVSQISGRGMGLSSVMKVVKNYSGEISALTKKNEGTKFVIEIPLSEHICI